MSEKKKEEKNENIKQEEKLEKKQETKVTKEKERSSDLHSQTDIKEYLQNLKITKKEAKKKEKVCITQYLQTL